MSALQDALSRAAVELGLRVSMNPAVVLADGRLEFADALFPDVGGPSGTLVVSAGRAEAKRGLLDAFKAQGYAVSTCPAYAMDGTFDLKAYMKMFCDWGWTQISQPKPAWMDWR